MFKPASAAPSDLVKSAVNTIKFLSVDGVEKANSGHPGLPMGAADFAYVLWTRFMKHDPLDPKWPDRDRFVLSGGHGSMLLYSLLHLSGYDLPLDELKSFRQFGSKTPGHPESHLTPGVEVTTGPLGQGAANAVGMALAARMAEARFPGLFNHRVWALVTDGDMQEGIASEAGSLAGHLKLSNLTYLYDDNKITLDGNLDESMSEDVAKRYEAYGWRTLHIDGHDHAQIEKALEAARAENERPMMILCRTIIGHGAPDKEGTHRAHGEPLGAAIAEKAKRAAGWPTDKPFLIPDEVHAAFEARKKELHQLRDEWYAGFAKWRTEHPKEAALYDAMSEKKVPANLLEELVAAVPKETDATRSLAGTIMQKAAALVPSLAGGDADLGGSTKTPIKDSPKVLHGQFAGRNLRFGIREHAMGGIANGMAGYGLFIPFTATFLTFSDYERPSIRLAALSEMQVVHVFTHDSIFLGEDGPTHQSIEHVSALRLIPNVDVWRPGDGLECACAWAAALERRHGPTEIILSRQKVNAAPAVCKAEDVMRGAYVLVREQGPGAPDVVFIATGSEVGAAVEAGKLIADKGKRVRVVSMPCMEVFERQDASYRASVLPQGTMRVSVEAGRTSLWARWIGERGLSIGVDRFGASAPAKVLAEKYELTGPQIAAKVLAHLGAGSGS